MLIWYPRLNNKNKIKTLHNQFVSHLHLQRKKKDCITPHLPHAHILSHQSASLWRVAFIFYFSPNFFYFITLGPSMVCLSGLWLALWYWMVRKEIIRCNLKSIAQFFCYYYYYYYYYWCTGKHTTLLDD